MCVRHGRLREAEKLAVAVCDCHLLTAYTAPPFCLYSLPGLCDSSARHVAAKPALKLKAAAED